MSAEIVAEAKPSGGVKPLTTAQMHSRKKKQDKAASNVRDVQASNAVRLGKVRQKLGDV